MQNTSHILMIRPVRFAFNMETAVNNAFQVPGKTEGVQEKEAAQEFDGLVALLRQHGVSVLVIDDTPEPYTPDSIFPNNWVSFHLDGTLVLYPMFAENRRLERKQAVLDVVAEQFEIKKRLDLVKWETKSRYLEGTGSIVLDRDNRLAYACLSPRTDAGVLEDFCRELQYRPVVFEAFDGSGLPIYHTNVMMCVADTYVVICADSISNDSEREMVFSMIEKTQKPIVTITLDQMNHFAGNMLQVKNDNGDRFLVMSSQAYQSLSKDQLETLTAFNPILHADLSTIESNGGGSARCMMAEIYLPAKTQR